MRKLSLLLGTLGGALAGYVFSNKQLRDELGKAKDAEAAGKILAKHLQKDGKQVGKEIQHFVQSEEVQGKMTEAKKYVKDNVKKMQGDLKDMVGKGATKAKKAATGATKSAAKKPTAKRAAAKKKG